MTIPAGDLTIIVRECGERTADACVRLLSEFYPGLAIHRVSARPFHETLRQSLELGVDEGRAWTLCIDADVLVLPEIDAFLADASILPPRTFEAQALILDKLIPSQRPAGNHLYRTELIPHALPLISTRNSLRPETDMIQAMAARGHPYHQSFRLLGLHDFEQTHGDVYMKAFLHGHKHRFLLHLFKPVWQELAGSDSDYQIALAALEDALQHQEVPFVSRSFREQVAQEAVAKLGIPEKPPLGSIDAGFVQGILESCGSTLSQEAKSLTSDIQVFIDTALSRWPARQGRSPASPATLAGRLRSWYRRLNGAARE